MEGLGLVELVVHELVVHELVVDAPHLRCGMYVRCGVYVRWCFLDVCH